MMRAPRTSLFLVGTTLAIGLVTACGDDDPAPAPVPSTTSAGGSGGAGGGTGGGGDEDAGIQIEGLAGPVQATYDENGILHLTCEEDDDCFAALGWFHAQNRFFFMDFVRNLVRGKLGNLVKAGDTVLSQDYTNRRFFSTREGDPLEDALYQNASPQVQGHLDAYTRGVNAWITDMRAGENGATLTTEYDFALIVKENIRDWEPQDSAAVGLYVLNDLSNNAPSELDLGAQVPLFDPALAVDLFSPAPVFDAFTISAPVTPAAPPAAGGDWLAPHREVLQVAAAQLHGLALGHDKVQGEVGSNNWVVGPDRSASGNALLANDPHLALTNPSIWFPAELDAKSAGNGEYHVAGGTFPGLPAVMIGQNETLAWGVTTAYYDLADVYLEELSADGSAVIFEGAEVPIIEKTLTFQNAATPDTPIEQTFRWVPHHGPIVSEDLAAGTAVSIRWRGHDAGKDLDAFFAIARAENIDEARTGLENASSANQNFVVVDAEGNFGWFPYAEVPERPWATPAMPPWLPLPGDGSAEWGAPVPYAELPQLLNPAEGVIATANADMTGATADGDPLNDGQAAIQAWSKAEGTRQQRILDLLEAGGAEHSVDTMRAIQGDTYSLYGSIAVPAFLEVATTATLTPEAQALVDVLAAWQLTCPTGVDGDDPITSPDVTAPDVAAESIGCSAFHAAYFALVEAALADESMAAGVMFTGGGAMSNLVARALIDPASLSSEAFWDDVSTMGAPETRDDILVLALERAAEALGDAGAENDWRWGRLHTLYLRSIYDNFGLTEYNIGPFAAPGGLQTVNVANPRTRVLPATEGVPDFGFTNGPSIRVVVEATPEGPTMHFQLPGGADLHKDSPFFNNLLPRWLHNEPIDFHFGPGAVTDPASTFEVTPAP